MQWLIDIVQKWIVAQGYLLHSFVDRGDPVNHDFITGNFTKDFTWYELDLSGIVPAGATAVLIHVEARTALANAPFILRTAGNVNTRNVSFLTTQVANIAMTYDFVIPLDAARKIEYTLFPVVWPVVNLTVKGWWL